MLTYKETQANCYQLEFHRVCFILMQYLLQIINVRIFPFKIIYLFENLTNLHVENIL